MYSQSFVWILPTIAEEVSRVMAPEEEPAMKASLFSYRPQRAQLCCCTVSLNLSSSAARQDACTYFLFISVSVTPFKDAFRLMMVGVKVDGDSSSVEVTALLTAQGPVSISMGTAFK